MSHLAYTMRYAVSVAHGASSHSAVGIQLVHQTSSEEFGRELS